MSERAREGRKESARNMEAGVGLVNGEATSPA